MTSIVVVGAGGHAKVIVDILGLSSHIVYGVVDDDPAKVGGAVGSLTVLGTCHELEGLIRRGLTYGAVVAIGHNTIRVAKATLLKALGYELITAVHPSAVCGERVVVGPGSVIMAGTVINCDTTIGENAIINTGATVDHDCLVSDGCHVSPGVHIAGNVHIDELAHIGIGASVLPNVRIGRGSVVGAGAVVLRDIPEGEVWAGNPARLVRSSSREI